MTLDEMQHELAGMLAADDVPGTWTPRQRDAYESRRRVLDAVIRAIVTHQQTLAELDPEITQLDQWYRDMSEVRQVLVDELMAMPQRSRDRQEMDKLQAWKASILMLDGRFDTSEAYPTSLPLPARLAARGYATASLFDPRGGLPALMQIEKRLPSLRARRADVANDLERLLSSLQPQPSVDAEQQPA